MKHVQLDPDARVRRPSPKLLIAMFLVVATSCVYAQVWKHDFIRFDDNLYVTDNHQVLEGLSWKGALWALTATHAGNWHPLTWLSHMADVELFGRSPGHHHLTNVALHVLNSVLLFVVLLRMTGALWSCCFVAALFALHPLHVESVAWIAERKDLLSAFFGLLTLYMYARYAERPGLTRYVPVMLALALGLMAKPMLVTLPAVLLLLDYWPLQRLHRDENWIRVVAEKIPLFLLSAASSAATLYAQRAAGALATTEHISIQVRIVNALISYVAYLAKFLWPSPLAVFYPHPREIDIAAATGALLLLAAVTGLSFAARRSLPAVAVGWLWFLGMLVPVIGLVRVGSQAMADRYTYLPSIGLFIAATWSVAYVATCWPATKRLFAATAGVVLAALMALTWLQVGLWKDTITLFQHATRVTDRNELAHLVLGNEFSAVEALSLATQHFQAAFEINPDNATARASLGELFRKQGRLDLATEYCEAAIRLQPKLAYAYVCLCITLRKQGKLDPAIEKCRRALELEPERQDAHANMGMLLMDRGETAEAVTHLRRVIQIKPRSADAHYYLGKALVLDGRPEEAIHHLEEALRLRYDHHLAAGWLRQARQQLAQKEGPLARDLPP